MRTSPMLSGVTLSSASLICSSGPSSPDGSCTRLQIWPLTKTAFLPVMTQCQLVRKKERAKWRRDNCFESPSGMKWRGGSLLARLVAER